MRAYLSASRRSRQNAELVRDSVALNPLLELTDCGRFHRDRFQRRDVVVDVFSDGIRGSFLVQAGRLLA